ncbi:growth hormone secretagogue receptor type 1-like [Saccoglossus kowalevskii]|uniref:Thyrotropin-releasing hormone receptor-like n=1 Tax=Saccoglossus kowalevskii TaxID=10224 RepID=A0ABM0MVZ7_SACKO|nr:PREDICTED: thyrotropin-releasing hormone receptor-like [Saccoglossus kowalevskii]
MVNTMNTSSDYNDLIDNNQCVIDARSENLTDFYTEPGTRDHLYDSQHILLTRIIPATITCPFGIILNCLFLYVVFKVSAMRTLTNMYLSNQAIVDCMFLSVYYIVQVGEPLSTDVVHDKSFLGPVGCFIVNIALDICLFVSEFNIVLVTFERNMAICKPFKSDRISSKSRTFKLIIFTWIMGLVFSAPIFRFYTNWHTTCILWPPSNETISHQMSYSNCFTVVLTPVDGILYSLTPIAAFFLVIVIIVVLNVLTIKELQRGVRKYSVSAHDLKQRLHQQRQIVVMLAVTAGALFVCLLPYHLDLVIGYLYNITHPNSVIAMPQAWNELVRWLPMVNSSINPIIYGILNKQYRSAFIATLRCCDNRRDKNNQNDYMMTSVTTCSTRKRSETNEVTYNLKSNSRNHSLELNTRSGLLYG